MDRCNMPRWLRAAIGVKSCYGEGAHQQNIHGARPLANVVGQEVGKTLSSDH